MDIAQIEDYLAGMPVPQASENGFPILARPAVSQSGMMTWRYGRDAQPPAVAPDVDYFDLFPATYRINTVDAAPQHVCTVAIPLNYEAKVQLDATSRTTVSQNRAFKRGRFECVVAGAIVNLYGGSGLVDEEAAFGALAVGGVTRVLIATGVQFFVTGIAATSIDWTIRVKRDLVRMRMP